MRFEDIRDISPLGAEPDILDMWSWSLRNPEVDLHQEDGSRWLDWRTEKEALQPRAAELWAMLVESAGQGSITDSGRMTFPRWYGKWWVEVIAYYPYHARLAEAIACAEEVLGVATEKVPTPGD